MKGGNPRPTLRSSRRVSEWPTAQCMTVLPLLFLLVKSAPRCSKVCTAAVKPRAAARSSAVCWKLSTQSISPPSYKSQDSEGQGGLITLSTQSIGPPSYKSQNSEGQGGLITLST